LRDFASALDTVEFIQLQTTDASIIGNIKQICYRGGKYYILDNQQHKILLFDEGGAFITSIDQRGPGPCEYLNMWDMYADDSGEIKVLSVTNPIKVISYNIEEGTCSEIAVTGWHGDKFFPWGDGYVFFASSGSEHPEKRFFLITDKDGNPIHKWLPSHPYVGYSMTDFKVFGSRGDTVLFNMALDNNIYQILPNGNISVRYKLDYGPFQMPKSTKKIFYDDFQKLEIYKGKYILHIEYWYETSQMALLSYVNPTSGALMFGIYSKSSKELLTLAANDDVSIALSLPLASINDSIFISCLDLSTYPFDEFPDYKDMILEKFPGLKPAIEAWTDYSNPILLKYKLKNL
jgi:hypothetical protein